MSRYRVLIIDDEPGVRRTLERALRGNHYEVVSAGDPNSAYQVLGETSFDVVLLDLRLPQISGDAFFLAIIGLIYIITGIFGTQTPTEQEVLELKALVCFIGLVVAWVIAPEARREEARPVPAASAPLELENVERLAA